MKPHGNSTRKITTRTRLPGLSRSHSSSAFTLIEILAAVVIMTVLAVLLLGQFKNYRERAQGAQCAGNLKALGVATAQYIADHNGKLPIAREDGSKSGSESGWDTDSVGAWYWNLAPYVDVPRWDTVRKYLGEQGKWIQRPNVFTCPGRRPTEQTVIKFPTTKPVSYAPPSTMSSAEATHVGETSNIHQLTIHQIKGLSKKIWLSDSPAPNVLNVSVARWRPEAADSYAWPRQGFTRHQGAGNALFFDGHVERIMYTEIANENLSENVQKLFHPTVEK